MTTAYRLRALLLLPAGLTSCVAPAVDPAQDTADTGFDLSPGVGSESPADLSFREVNGEVWAVRVGHAESPWLGRFDDDLVALSRTEESSPILLRFASWGRYGAVHAVGKAATRLNACDRFIVGQTTPLDEGMCDRRIERVHTGVTEWWVHRAEGLEQGWDVSERPAGEGPLSFDIDVDAADVRAVGPTAALRSEDGLWLYVRDARAWDATGRSLPTTLEVEGLRLHVVVDDRDAQFPIRVDPLTTSTQFADYGITAAGKLGYSVAAGRNVNSNLTTDLSDIVSGAPGLNKFKLYYNGTTAGSVYISEPVADADATSPNNQYGFAVAIGKFVGNDAFADVAVSDH